MENAIEKQKEYLDEKMDKLKDYVDEQMVSSPLALESRREFWNVKKNFKIKIQNIMQREVQDCLRKVEQTQTDMKQEFDSIHEK